MLYYSEEENNLGIRTTYQLEWTMTPPIAHMFSNINYNIRVGGHRRRYWTLRRQLSDVVTQDPPVHRTSCLKKYKCTSLDMKPEVQKVTAGNYLRINVSIACREVQTKYITLWSVAKCTGQKTDMVRECIRNLVARKLRRGFIHVFLMKIP